MDKYFQYLIIKSEDVKLSKKKIEIIQNNIDELDNLLNRLIQIAEIEKENSEHLNTINASY